MALSLMGGKWREHLVDASRCASDRKATGVRWAWTIFYHSPVSTEPTLARSFEDGKAHLLSLSEVAAWKALYPGIY